MDSYKDAPHTGATVQIFHLIAATTTLTALSYATLHALTTP
jgi:hypothetical protein